MAMGSESLCLMSILSYLRSSSIFSVLSHKWKKVSRLGEMSSSRKGKLQDQLLQSLHMAALQAETSWNIMTYESIIGITAASRRPALRGRLVLSAVGQHRDLWGELWHMAAHGLKLSASPKRTCMWHACDMHDILFTLRFDILWLDYDILSHLSLCANRKKCKNLGASLQIRKVSHPFSLSLALCLTHDVNVTARAFHKGHIVALSVEAKRSHFECAHGVLVVKRWNWLSCWP